MGLNGVDNAKLSFDNVRVPRENLLNRYSDVTPEGKFESDVGSGRARFLTVADQVIYQPITKLFASITAVTFFIVVVRPPMHRSNVAGRRQGRPSHRS